MKVSFYNNSSERNILNKSISKINELDIVMKDTFNIKNPNVLVSNNDIKTLGNYIYIESVDRYYFIDRYEILNNNLIRLYMTCDYLMTFKDVILNSSGYVTQSKNIQNYASEYNVLDTLEQKVDNFSDVENKFSNNKIYLIGAN